MSRSWRRHSEYVYLGSLVVWTSKPSVVRFLGFGPQKSVGVSAGTGGGTWHNHEAYVEAKQSREERVAVGCTD